MASGLFLTGTDTHVGKTVVAVAMLRGLVAAGVRAVGMKPVSAGFAEGRGENDDVIALQGAGNVDAPLLDRNPFAFRDAIAPHLAARGENVAIDLRAIGDAYARLCARADAVVVEGAGGALVPLDDRHDVLDIPRQLGLPVVLVVGIRLGCLNHARLSALAVRARGLRLAGFIACRIDPSMPRADENVRWLDRELACPRIADLRSPHPAPLSRDALHGIGMLPPP